MTVPRGGLAYDVFGNGRTALKVHLGKYVEAATADAIYSANNPAARIVTRVGSGAGSPARGAGVADSMTKYASDLEEFPDLRRAAAQSRKIPAAIVEKDY